MQPNSLLSVFTRGKTSLLGWSAVYWGIFILESCQLTAKQRRTKASSGSPWRLGWCQPVVNTRFLNCIDEVAGWSSVRQEHETPKYYRSVGHWKGKNWAALDGVMQSTFLHRILGLRADTGCGEWSQTSHNLIVGLLSGWKLACVFSPVP